MFATATLTWAAENGLDLGFFTLRYYSLLFAAGFFLGYRQMRKWFASAGLNDEQLDTLLTTMVVATVVGARLGHVFFYDWHYYQNHLVEILYVWEGGLASHGAAAAILVAVFWYAKYVIHKPYLWMMDRLVITVALAAVFIRTGNLMNSEIYGDPANSVAQTVFARPVLDLIDNHYGHALTGARLERDANRPDRETDSLSLPAYRLVVQPVEGFGKGNSCHICNRAPQTAFILWVPRKRKLWLWKMANLPCRDMAFRATPPKCTKHSFICWCTVFCFGWPDGDLLTPGDGFLAPS
jgi:hypothetical protein